MAIVTTLICDRCGRDCGPKPRGINIYSETPGVDHKRVDLCPACGSALDAFLGGARIVGLDEKAPTLGMPLHRLPERKAGARDE